MSTQRCLYCYEGLSADEIDFHKRCSETFFGTGTPPQLDYDIDEMEKLAKDIVTRSIAVTGVQPKLSLSLEPIPGEPKHFRLTIVGLCGGYILKPPTKEFAQLPENEDLTMHLATVFGVATAQHSLIRLRSGELAYITKRFDRANGEKLALEDMCQLTETLTINKYRSSMEKIARAIREFVPAAGLSLLALFEQTIFNYLTGNADMHLKNFSLLTDKRGDTFLSPAYDLLSTKILLPEDKDETALTINGRKRKLVKKDFDLFGKNIGLSEKVMLSCYSGFATRKEKALSMIARSFLNKIDQEAYKKIMNQNIDLLAI